MVKLATDDIIRLFGGADNVLSVKQLAFVTENSKDISKALLTKDADLAKIFKGEAIEGIVKNIDPKALENLRNTAADTATRTANATKTTESLLADSPLAHAASKPLKSGQEVGADIAQNGPSAKVTGASTGSLPKPNAAKAAEAVNVVSSPQVKAMEESLAQAHDKLTDVQWDLMVLGKQKDTVAAAGQKQIDDLIKTQQGKMDALANASQEARAAMKAENAKEMAKVTESAEKALAEAAEKLEVASGIEKRVAAMEKGIKRDTILQKGREGLIGGGGKSIAEIAHYKQMKINVLIKKLEKIVGPEDAKNLLADSSALNKKVADLGPEGAKEAAKITKIMDKINKGQTTVDEAVRILGKRLDTGRTKFWAASFRAKHDAASFVTGAPRALSGWNRNLSTAHNLGRVSMKAGFVGAAAFFLDYKFNDGDLAKTVGWGLAQLGEGAAKWLENGAKGALTFSAETSEAMTEQIVALTVAYKIEKGDPLSEKEISSLTAMVQLGTGDVIGLVGDNTNTNITADNITGLAKAAITGDQNAVKDVMTNIRDNSDFENSVVGHTVDKAQNKKAALAQATKEKLKDTKDPFNDAANMGIMKGFSIAMKQVGSTLSSMAMTLFAPLIQVLTMALEKAVSHFSGLKEDIKSDKVAKLEDSSALGAMVEKLDLLGPTNTLVMG